MYDCYCHLKHLTLEAARQLLNMRISQFKCSILSLLSKQIKFILLRKKNLLVLGSSQIQYGSTCDARVSGNKAQLFCKFIIFIIYYKSTFITLFNLFSVFLIFFMCRSVFIYLFIYFILLFYFIYSFFANNPKDCSSLLISNCQSLINLAFFLLFFFGHNFDSRPLISSSTNCF